MAEDFDSTIATKRTELETLKSQMEDLRIQFTKESADFIANWYGEAAKGFAAGDSDNTLKLGKQRVTIMKNKVQELANKSEVIAFEVLSNKSIWWHLDPSGKDLMSYMQTGTFYPEIIDKPLRRALGKLGTILEEYGYKVNTKAVYTGGMAESWYEYSTDKGYPPSQPTPYYPRRFGWSNEMQETLRKYNELYQQAMALNFEVIGLQMKKQSKQATDLWDSS